MTKRNNQFPPRQKEKDYVLRKRKTQADLRIRLKYDDMNQSEFFRAIVQGYLEQDTRIVSFVDEYKENYEIQGKPRRRKSRILRDKGQETKNKFALDKEMIENIFDLLEKEHPDI